MLRVTDLETGSSVVVRINDRGPFGRGVLDLSAHAATDAVLAAARHSCRLGSLRLVRLGP